MTYVITTSNLDISTTKTISSHRFCLLAGLVSAVMVGIGIAAGLGIASFKESFDFEQNIQLVKQEITKKIEQEYEQKALDYQQNLIDHIGELSARLINLEQETGSLAEKVNVVHEFEERMQIKNIKTEKKANIQPGSIGGPFIDAQDAKDNKSSAADSKKNADVKKKSVVIEHNEQSSLSPAAVDKLQVDNSFAKHNTIADKINLNDKFNQTSDIQQLVMLEDNIRVIDSFLSNLERHVSSVSLKHMYFPGRKPVKTIRISSGFGNRVDPGYRKKGIYKFAFHSGIDFAAPTGTPIYASGGGKVIFAGSRSSYGNVVEIDHGAGIVTRYAHTSKVLVQKGQMVMPGDEIAKVGSTGRSFGSHLHFEVLKDGRFVNPNVYLSRF